MIKKEYDSIDDMLLSESNPRNDYESAKEAHNLLLDALNLTDNQKILLKGSYAYLEELLEKKTSADEKKEPKTVRIGSSVFRYDDTLYSYKERKITGEEIIDWIIFNDLEDVALYVSEEGIYTRLLDVDDDDHYKEIRINWDTNHGKYETLEDHLEPED